MTALQQFNKFLSKYDKLVAATAKKALAKLRKLVPGATEMVYDNYNALAIGFGPTEKASQAIFSIALYPKHVTLFFLQGAILPDPNKRLSGSGNVVRYVRLESEETLDDPAVLELINVALHRARVPLDPKAKRKLIIKSISANQRARKPVKSKDVKASNRW